MRIIARLSILGKVHYMSPIFRQSGMLMPPQFFP